MSNSANALILCVILLFIVVFPLITIWALNTLFALAIPTTLATWFAAFWLQVIFAAKVATSK